MSISIVATVDPRRSRVDARNANGHTISMGVDPPEADGGVPGPKEILLAALAGCTSLDVASILRKKRQSAESYAIAVTGEIAPRHPKVFIAIRVEHRVRGDVEPEALRRSIELSSTRYCPVSAMLSASATLEHRYSLTGADGRAHTAVVAITGPDGARVL